MTGQCVLHLHLTVSPVLNLHMYMTMSGFYMAAVDPDGGLNACVACCLSQLRSLTYLSLYVCVSVCTWAHLCRCACTCVYLCMEAVG